MSSTSFAVLLSALPHCRIFSKSTATREWLTYTLDILKFETVETVKPRFSVDTLNDIVDDAKSCQWERFILQFAAKKHFPRDYFFAADRGDVYIIKGHKNLIAFISFASHSKVVHSEDHFSEEGLFGSRFSKSSFKFTGKWKVRVSSHVSVSKYHANKNYANLWFILLQVTKGFRFQKNKNVRFISGNFSSERFSWKVKTIRVGLYILINKHLQYQCLEFTILKRTWPIFAKTIITSHSNLPPKFFQYLLLLYARDLNMSRLTCNAVLRLVYADFT